MKEEIDGNHEPPIAFYFQLDTKQQEESRMDERLTLHILWWTVTTVVMSCFLLGGLSLPH